MKKYFFRSNNPGVTYLFLLFTEITDFQKSKQENLRDF